jgi:hypothetical protein
MWRYVQLFGGQVTLDHREEFTMELMKNDEG